MAKEGPAMLIILVVKEKIKFLRNPSVLAWPDATKQN